MSIDSPSLLDNARHSNQSFPSTPLTMRVELLFLNRVIKLIQKLIYDNGQMVPAL